jgi:hypothetical protein
MTMEGRFTSPSGLAVISLQKVDSLLIYLEYHGQLKAFCDVIPEGFG